MVALRTHLRPAMANTGAAQVESQPEAHRNSNRPVIEGKAARCNWHCHQPVRRVKAGCRIQPGPADQIISSEAYLGLFPFDHRPVPCALPYRVWHGSHAELDELFPVLIRDMERSADWRPRVAAAEAK